MSGTKLNRIVIQHLDGARKGDLETFAQASVSIGRSGDCDLVFINEKSTSIHHAVLRQKQDSVELLDTQSTNGTFLNDVRIERAVLKDGDIVRFGVLGPKVKIGLSVHDGQAGINLPVSVINAPVSAAVPLALALQTNIAGINPNTATPASAMPPMPLAEDATNAPSNNWGVVRTALMFYAGASVAAIGVFDTVSDLYQPDVRWFTVFLIFMAGGAISTAVEAWYRGTPGTQKIRWWEVLTHLAVLSVCVGISALIWR